LKRVFDRYSNASKAKGRDTFDEDNGSVINQVDLLKMFKEKNIEKNKTLLQEVYKFVQKDKGQQGIDYEGFLRYLEQYCIGTYHRDKNYTI
jgi:Ca2+-binding EF-hand superfamily protein